MKTKLMLIGLAIIAVILFATVFTGVTVTAQEKKNAEYANTLNDLQKQIYDLSSNLSIQHYDYIVYGAQNDSTSVLYYAKNGNDGNIEFFSNDAASVFNFALETGKFVFAKSGSYILNSDVIIRNKENALLTSDGDATLLCDGHKIIVYGNTCHESKYNTVSGFIIFNGGVRIENSYMTTVSNMIFQNCNLGIELVATNTWTESSKIDDVQFYSCSQGIVFRSLEDEGTGSFQCTMISRCYFNLPDNSIAISVEKDAGFTDGQMKNVHIWAACFPGQQTNQTGLQVSGSLYRTAMNGVVFESFAVGNLSTTSLYAVHVNTTFQTPIIQEGVTFLGNWTKLVYNPYNSQVEGNGIAVAFKRENMTVPLAADAYPAQPLTIQVAPATFAGFNAKIRIDGCFEQNESVTVRFRLQCFDNLAPIGSEVLEKTFNASCTVWLSNDDLLCLMPYQNVIQTVLVDGWVDSNSSDVQVWVSVFGGTTWSEIL
ncbi:MAG: hypothetical protein ACFCUE_00230 [Candidatus Bathyarchaeia archaeon]|jgi:hypothetical protein